MRQHNESRHISSIDNRGVFHRKKIAEGRRNTFSARKTTVLIAGVWRKGHTPKQTIAMRRALLLQCHEFRRKFGQTNEQLTLSHASRIEGATLDIIFL